MYKTLLPISLLAVSLACNQTANNNEDESSASGEPEKKLSLTPVSSPDFPNASIQLNKPLLANKKNEVAFDFDVSEFQLTSQTEDAERKNCANSDQGQHIHLILNNEPYMARYASEFTEKLENGHYVMLAFLSRSYHESLKHKTAYVLSELNVGNEKDTLNLEAPHLFYSRPKGTYVGDDIHNLLLDFYLVNTELSPNGNKVRATINNEIFLIDKWQPYFINGADYGNLNIILELIDNEGNLIKGPFNKVSRTVNLVQKTKA